MTCKTLPVFVLAASAALSCKKGGDAPPSVASRLQGTWHTAFVASDQNRNQVLDDGERMAIPADSVVFVFSERGAGTMAVGGTSAFPITWSLLNNDQQLLVRFPGTSLSTGADSIHTLTGTDLILESRDDSVRVWSGFKR